MVGTKGRGKGEEEGGKGGPQGCQGYLMLSLSPASFHWEEHRGPCSEESLMEHPGGGGSKLAKVSSLVPGHQPVASLADKWVLLESHVSVFPTPHPSFLMNQEQEADLGPLILNIAAGG